MTAVRVSSFLLTGFLGSGKTTLLRALLTRPGFQDTAIIVNELGEIGLDHELISFSADRTIVMPGGCVCCTIREDIETSLRELFASRDAGRIPPFSRLVIETTGIADPVPLLMTLRANPLALSRLAEPRVVTIVDAVLGSDTLAQYGEAESQVVQADMLVISKPDLAPKNRIEALKSRLAALNPWASIRVANLLDGPLAELFVDTGAVPGYGRDLEAWVTGRREHIGEVEHAHGHCGIRSFGLTLQSPLDWNGFAVWMTMLLHRHGSRVLRVKGLLDIDGLAGPTVFQSAQHLVHPPLHLDLWPGADRRSRLVFILRDLDPALVEASLRAFDRAARNLAPRADFHRPAGAGGMIAGRPIKRPTAPAWIKG